MRRILILGSSGSGKSTLARDLGSRLGLPVKHLDQMVWRPGWVLRDRVETDEELESLLKEPAWILDGAFRRHLPLAVEAADTVLFLDVPRWLCLKRVIRRVIQTRGQVRSDMADGCPEQVDLGFLLWIWRWNRDHRPVFVKALEGKTKARIFRRSKELEAWLKESNLDPT